MKKRIRLTEGDLHNIIRKCVNEVSYYPNGVETFVSYTEKFLTNAEYILNKLEDGREDGDEGLNQIIKIGKTLLDTVYCANEEIKDISHLQPVSYYKD